jgi:hypothetical protein
VGADDEVDSGQRGVVAIIPAVVLEAARGFALVKNAGPREAQALDDFIGDVGTAHDARFFDRGLRVGTAARFKRERVHSDSVSSARFAAARHIFSSRGRARMLRLIERGEATGISSNLALYACQYKHYCATDPSGSRETPVTEPSTVLISRRQLFELLINALRYAIGRSTYVTTEVADAVREHWRTLSPQERQMIYQDVCQAVAEAVADTQTVWQPLKRWIEAASEEQGDVNLRGVLMNTTPYSSLHHVELSSVEVRDLVDALDDFISDTYRGANDLRLRVMRERLASLAPR